jgi:hypothetical protein
MGTKINTTATGSIFLSTDGIVINNVILFTFIVMTYFYSGYQQNLF